MKYDHKMLFLTGSAFIIFIKHLCFSFLRHDCLHAASVLCAGVWWRLEWGNLITRNFDILQDVSLPANVNMFSLQR